MARRKSTNKTGISRLPNIQANNAWAVYICVNCRNINYVPVGDSLLTPQKALSECDWECSNCGFIHSINSALPKRWEHWDKDALSAGSDSCERFWKGFFTIATERPESYWKQCNVCGRILPNSAFSKHANFGPLEKQMECRSCKNAINAIGNPKRTSEQLRESSARRRLGDLLTELDKEEEKKLDINDLFERFNGKCFVTGKPLDISKRDEWNIDHILPSKYFYPLTKENAALLSKEANSNKRDIWPSQFYTPQQLVELSNITGANIALLSSPEPIQNANINVDSAVSKWLDVRNSTSLHKRVNELVKILKDNNLTDKLSDENKKRLGIK